MEYLLSLLYIILSCIIIWRSAHGFEMAADYLGRRLPLGIKGASINAIASSMPEFLTTLFFLFWLKDVEAFSAGLAVSSGSALFNLLIIPAGAVLMIKALKKKKAIELNRWVVFREGTVLLVSQALFIAFLFSKDLRGYQGLILVLIYFIYLLFLHFQSNRQMKSDPGFEAPAQQQLLPWLQRILLLDVSNSVLNGKTLTRNRAWLLLGVTTLIMTAGTWLLVHGTHMFGRASGIHLVFLSVVLSAAATSVPDTILSLKDARKGNYDDAISNALGSNIFDIAFALGLPILIYNLVHPGGAHLDGEELRFTQEVWVYLFMATVFALLVMVLGNRFTRFKAWLLIGIYALFLFFVGTQVNTGLMNIGEPIGEFLTRIADWLGDILY